MKNAVKNNIIVADTLLVKLFSVAVLSGHLKL